jgi:predicted DNA-binding transcriptional regulator YafY
LIIQFEKYCVEEQRIIITYKLPIEEEEKHIVLEPNSIKYDLNEVYIYGFSPITGEKQLLQMDYIISIKQLPVKSKYNYALSPLIFKLKGRVASGYRAYEGEKVTEIDELTGSITVSAYVEDHNMVLNRLLKYGDQCEILYPKSLRNRVVKTIQDALKNYESEVLCSDSFLK